MEGWGATTRPCYNSICYLLSMVPNGIILQRRLLPPPPPIPLLVSPAIAVRCPLPIIRCLLLLRNSPPNLGEYCRHHRPLSLHPSPHQRYDIAPAVVPMTPQCRSREMLMLMSTLASTVFALRCRPLVERRCHVHSHIAPDARRCRCCRHRCHLRVVVVIAATPTIAEPMPPGEPSRRHLPVRQRACLCPISFLLIVA